MKDSRWIESWRIVNVSPLSLRMVYLHVNCEYARHNGHADLLRQCIDGVTGR